jgi:hypothetical protein
MIMSLFGQATFTSCGASKITTGVKVNSCGGNPVRLSSFQFDDGLFALQEVRVGQQGQSRDGSE